MSYSINKIVEIYDEASVKTAEMISYLADLKHTFDYISNQTKDNADPAIETSESLERLGILLASIVIYKNEYSQDLKKEQKDVDKDNKKK